MMIQLKRYSYGENETEGVLLVADKKFATIEQPWVPNPNGKPGGKPNHSCIPDGMYRLAPFKRPDDGDANHIEEDVWIIFNEDLGVYRLPGDHLVDAGRNLCLIHKANFADDVAGCVAPGIRRQPMKSRHSGKIEQAVASSGDAMAIIRRNLGMHDQHILAITNNTGASDVK